MTSDEARIIIGLLIAAYPDATLEPESVEVYGAAIVKWQSLPAARLTVEQVVESSPRFPSIAQLRETYLGHVRRLEERAESQRRALEPVASGPRETPVLVREMITRLDTRPVERPSSLPLAETGSCSDCKREVSERFLLGRMVLCARCAGSRLRVAEMVDRNTSRESRATEGEEMDEFLRRTEHLEVAASLRRLAWATGRSVEEVVEDYDRLLQAQSHGEAT